MFINREDEPVQVTADGLRINFDGEGMGRLLKENHSAQAEVAQTSARHLL